MFSTENLVPKFDCKGKLNTSESGKSLFCVADALLGQCMCSFGLWNIVFVVVGLVSGCV